MTPKTQTATVPGARSSPELRIAEVLEARAREIGAIGMSAGVAHAGRQPVFGACGSDGRDPETPMTPAGRVRIGSVTKTFTSALVLDLVDQQELALDDTINRWVPTYPHAAQISIRSLLTHTSGTADVTSDALSDYLNVLLADLSRRYTPDEAVSLSASLPAHSVAANEYRYSNTDYVLLGLIVERVAGASFSELLTRRFTVPLALEDTAYDESVPDDLKHGWFDLETYEAGGTPARHDLDVRDFPNEALITTAYAAGGMTSSIADLLSWGEALYLGGALSPSMRDQLLASPSVEDPETGRWHGFGVVGYGERSPDGSWPAYGHAGNLPGSSAFVASFPRSGATVAIHANVQEVSTEVLIDIAFGICELAASA